MTVEEIADAHYRNQQRIARLAIRQAYALWGQVDPARVRESWLDLLADIIRVLAGGQAAAAAQAQRYLDALAAEQQVPPSPFMVDPLALAGVAADGRTLAGLLMQPALRTLGLLARGADDQDALRSGLASLVNIVDTEIADASRAADQVGITARREWVMYVRHVTLPACARCIVLAGRVYSYSTGFERHERCDCTMVPHREGNTPPPNPRALFDQMSADEQNKAFTAAGAEAIRLGADVSQVVNARRGMKVAGGRQTTTEGSTRRGVAGKRLRGQTRLMPAQILQDAGGDRDRAIQLLHEHGYLIDRPQVAPKGRDQAVLASRRTESTPYQRDTTNIRDLVDASRRMDDAQVSALSGGQSATTELVRLPNGAFVRKTGMDWGDPNEVAASLRAQADAEQLASLVGQAIGAPVVRVYRENDDTVWMNWVEGNVGAGDVSGTDGQLLGLLDHLIANADRNSGNIITSPDGLVGIDHGWSWGEHNLAETGPIVQDTPDRPAAHYSRDGQWVPNPLTVQDVDTLRARLRALRPDFDLLGRGSWLDYSLGVLDEVAPYAGGRTDLLG
ncbi:VG15 protein [Nonomuraea sp. NPDC004702]